MLVRADLPWDIQQRDVMGWGSPRVRCAQTRTNRREALVPGPANMGAELDLGQTPHNKTVWPRARTKLENSDTALGLLWDLEFANGCSERGVGGEGEVARGLRCSLPKEPAVGSGRWALLSSAKEVRGENIRRLRQEGP